MSFSSDVKEELSKQISSARHCQIAELTAIISLCGNILISEDDTYTLKIQTENEAVARKFFTLLKKGFNIDTDVSIREYTHLKRGTAYTVWVREHEATIKILTVTKLINPQMEIGENLSLMDNLLLQKICCKRAFIRGAFLANGSISDPMKSYHFEIACTSKNKAEQLQATINAFENMEAKIVTRKRHYVIYIKEGDQIVQILNMMEAHLALMDLENVRILKEVRNSVNRKVNCETANINKVVSAAMKQVEDIRYLSATIGLESLTKGLEEIARLRLEHSDIPLKELGMMLTPTVGKSGVNHRLRKLSTLAEELREKQGGAIL